MFRYNLLVIFLVILFTGCSEQTESKKSIPSLDVNQFSQSINEQLNGWNLKTKVESFINNDTLLVQIQYLGKGTEGYSPFFLDDYSNELIVSVLVYERAEIIKQFDVTKLTLQFEDYADGATFFVKESNLIQYQKYFENELFYKNVNQCLSSLGYNEVVFIESTIKFINENLERFDYKGTFWELLNQYSNFCNQGKLADKPAAELFIIVNRMLNGLDDPKMSKEIGINLLPIIETCGMSQEAFNYDSLQLVNYIDGFVKN
jgi:hypothetical protein